MTHNALTSLLCPHIHLSPVIHRSPAVHRPSAWVVFLVLILAWFTAPDVATAQTNDARPESYTRGLYVDGMLAGSTVSYDGSDGVDPGAVFSGRVGYGFTDLFGIFAEVGAGAYASEQDLTEVVHPDNYVAGFFDLGVQFNFRSGKVWVPYAEIALNGFATGDEFENNLSGGGLTLGGGLKYYLTDAWAFNGRLMLTGHTIETVDVDGRRFQDVEEDAASTRFAFGLTWYVLR